MKSLAIVIPVLNSHEVVRRQLMHLERVGLDDGVELILVDDGSDPPLAHCQSIMSEANKLDRFRIIATNDFRPWTWALARNAAARLAIGEKLLMFDLDHIITRELVDFVLAHDADRIHFQRRFGVLDKEGRLLTDRATLESWGLLERKDRIESHQNSFAMKRQLFWELGGYREDLIGQPYPQGEDSGFFRKWKAYSEQKGIKSLEGPTLYVFPNGRWCGDVDQDKLGLFHTLSRKSPKNYHWNKQRERECQ